MVNSANAAVATYTLSGGTIDGTLNGVSFSGANFTITADADPANFVPGAFSGEDYLPMLSQSATSTMTIDGFATFKITNANFGPFLADFSANEPGFAVGGFGFDLDTPNIRAFAAVGPVPSLSGNVTVTGALGLDTVVFTTDAGDLVVTSFDNIGAMYTGEFPSSAVPEPTSMAIFGLGSLGMAYRARRKLKA